MLIKRLVVTGGFAAMVAAFCGLMTAALLPLAFPSVLAVTSPIVCPAGTTAEAVRQQFSDRQGTGFTQTVACVSESGEVVRKGNNLEVPTIAIMACIPFFLVLSVVFFTMGKVEAGNPSSPDFMGFGSATPPAASSGTLNDKLEQLNQAYQAGHITEDEFTEKKKDLLDNL